VNPRVVRGVLIGVCAAGIAGMIVTSIADSPGGALTFGLITAVAAVGMILVTAVTTGGSARGNEELAAELEERVQALVSAGADESAIRDVVRRAVQLGKTLRP
jgi:multisubunit Na+/H+ antiporter MnhB subunit